MALFTKLFERNYHPYDFKTRWVKIHVKNGAIDYYDNIPQISPGFSSPTFMYLGQKVTVLDYVVVDMTVTASVSYPKEISVYVNNNCAIKVPSTTSASEYTVYAEIKVT